MNHNMTKDHNMNLLLCYELYVLSERELTICTYTQTHLDNCNLIMASN